MGERDGNSNDLPSSIPFFPSFFSSCMLPHFPPHRPYYALCRYLFPLLRVVFVRKIKVIFFVLFRPCNSSYPHRVFVRVQQVSFFSSTYGVPLWQLQLFLSFPIFLHHILQNTLLFVLVCLFVRLFACFFFLFFSLLLFFSSFFSSSFFMDWLVLLCSRTRYVSTSPALH